MAGSGFRHFGQSRLGNATQDARELCEGDAHFLVDESTRTFTASGDLSLMCALAEKAQYVTLARSKRREVLDGLPQVRDTRLKVVIGRSLQQFHPSVLPVQEVTHGENTVIIRTGRRIQTDVRGLVIVGVFDALELDAYRRVVAERDVCRGVVEFGTAIESNETNLLKVIKWDGPESGILAG